MSDPIPTPPRTLVPLSIGSMASLRRSFSQSDVLAFGEVTGDLNPLHFEGKVAASGRFGRPIVHGMFAAGIFSKMLAMDLPGPGTVYLSQSLTFMAPLFFDTDYEFRVEVVGMRSDRPIYDLSTVCLASDGKVVIEGLAKVLFEQSPK